MTFEEKVKALDLCVGDMLGMKTETLSKIIAINGEVWTKNDRYSLIATLEEYIVVKGSSLERKLHKCS